MTPIKLGFGGTMFLAFGVPALIVVISLLAMAFEGEFGAEGVPGEKGFAKRFLKESIDEIKSAFKRR